MVFPIRPALRPILFGSLIALVCGSVAAVGMLPGKIAERARKAETSATGSQLQIAVKPPIRAPIAAPTGKLATLPQNYADAAAAPPQVAPSHVVRGRDRGATAQADEVIVDDEDEVAIAPHYARATPRWRNAPLASADEAYDEPPAVYPPARERYRSYREEERRDDQRPEARALSDDRYVPAPYLGERYYPSWRR